MQIILIVAIFAMMYFMVVRPQKRQQQALTQLRDSLSVGDQVTTIGGIRGEITQLVGEDIYLKSAGEARLLMKKTAVASRDDAVVTAQDEVIDVEAAVADAPTEPTAQPDVVRQDDSATVIIEKEDTN